MHYEKELWAAEFYEVKGEDTFLNDFPMPTRGIPNRSTCRIDEQSWIYVPYGIDRSGLIPSFPVWWRFALGDNLVGRIVNRYSEGAIDVIAAACLWVKSNTVCKYDMLFSPIMSEDLVTCRIVHGPQGGYHSHSVVKRENESGKVS